MNELVKEFWKSVHICQSYYQTFKGHTFLRHSIAESVWLTIEWETCVSAHGELAWQCMSRPIETHARETRAPKQ